MLASSLHEMIYNSEAVFFLNTYKSAKVTTKNLVKKTESGWIYSEIKMCDLVQRRLPEEHPNRITYRKKIMLSKAEEMNESQKSFEWTLDTSKFVQLVWNDLKKWKLNKVQGTHALDTLYKQCQLLV